MSLNPFDQFKVRSLVDLSLFDQDISFTNSSLFMFIAVFLVGAFCYFASRSVTLIPGKLQSSMEIWFEFVEETLVESAGKSSKGFFPFIFTIFSFVTTLNVLGLLPYSFSVTSQLIITFAMAIVVFFAVIITGFVKHGIKFLSLFLPSGTPAYIAPLMVLIELFSFLVLIIFATSHVKAIEFQGKFTQGHFILGKTDPEAKIKVNKKEVKVERVNKSYKTKWDKDVDDGLNGTLFNKLSFLEYHKDKFQDNVYHIVFTQGQKKLGVFSFLKVSTKSECRAKSLYGGSYGGIVLVSQLNLEKAVNLVKALINYLKIEGVNKIELSLNPQYCSFEMDQNIQYALVHCGFSLQALDSMAVLKLPNSVDRLWDNLKGSVRTVLRNNSEDFEIYRNADLNEFYNIALEDKKRHNNAPITHTIEELKYLEKKFPNEIWADIAIHKTGAKAGNLYFKCNSELVMTAYLSQENNALGLNGTTHLLFNTFKYLIVDNIKLFDFGQMTDRNLIPNMGVSKFKESFGAVGRLREFYYYEL